MLPRAVGGCADAVRELTNRLVAGLAASPLQPSAAELAAVTDGGLEGRRGAGALARSAAARYAFLFADHVVPDVIAPGAAGAYVRLWLCARRAFLDQRTNEAEGSVATDLDAWQNEGGANAV